MGFWDRLRRPKATRIDRDATKIAESTLREFVGTRQGVEGWVEHPTSFNPPSLLLVAHDGEWLRHVIPSMEWGQKFCASLHLPCHQAGIVSYPQRMRDYNARQKGRRFTQNE